ncbi:MAG: nuclear transport factor 2 family protein [Planctomycetes bacterium]|nr:nuclear transport factor 2 family protein [Planctomycetota bacterium]
MLVGALDEGWLDRSRRTLELLKSAGVEASLEVIPEQKHVLNVPGPKLFGLFEVDPRGAAKRDVAKTLDDFHDAAAKADEARYFAHFTPDAVFIGTDATERWTKEEFRAWAKPYFARGTAWKYTPKSRNVYVFENTAWFDEMLDNPRLSECRGTGVLLRDETGVWRIAQYHLVVPVPNELADDLVKRGKALKK